MDHEGANGLEEVHFIQALAKNVIFKAEVTHTSHHTVHKVPHGSCGVHVLCALVLNSKLNANTYPQGEGSPQGSSTPPMVSHTARGVSHKVPTWSKTFQNQNQSTKNVIPSLGPYMK